MKTTVAVYEIYDMDGNKRKVGTISERSCVPFCRSNFKKFADNFYNGENNYRIKVNTSCIFPIEIVEKSTGNVLILDVF